MLNVFIVPIFAVIHQLHTHVLKFYIGNFCLIILMIVTPSGILLSGKVVQVSTCVCRCITAPFEKMQPKSLFFLHIIIYLVLTLY